MKCGIWLLLAIPLLAQEKPTEIVVIGGSGWKFNGKPIKRQDTLYKLGRLTGTSSSDLILECRPEEWLAYTCTSACEFDPCARQAPGVTVRQVHPYAWAKPQPSQPNFLTSLFRREGNSVENLGVRAATNISDAVLLQRGETVLWSPALARVLEGSYCFQVGRIPASSAKPRTFNLAWNREGDAGVELRGLPPGLYTLERGTPGANGACHIEDPDAAKAWVLIAGGTDFERVHKEWTSYAAGLDKLRDEATPEVAATVSHAILSSLADSIGK